MFSSNIKKPILGKKALQFLEVLLFSGGLDGTYLILVYISSV
jgi:hypothetical protein